MNTRYDLITAPFSGTIDLAAAKIGGQALLASDEFFAGKENLLEPGRGVWIDGKFTDRGKWMDGWESRRKRVPGHDWCIIKLGAPGLIKGLDIDTNNFLGNHPPFASVDALHVTAEQPPEELANRKDWVRILPKSPLREGSQNIFSVDATNTYSHIRLNIYPDGGVARLRVYGIVHPEPIIDTETSVDLASVLAGATVPAASDMFFGNKEQLLHPGRGRNMGDGWETRRRRGPGHDWSVISLGREGILKEILVDTAHFKGNYPDRCSLEGVYLPQASRLELDYPALPWRPIFGETKLQADAEHRFAEFQDAGPFSHLRLRIYPDGGVSRLRAFCLPLVHEHRQATVANSRCCDALASKSLDDRRSALLSCLSSPTWANALLELFPHANDADLIRAAVDRWYALDQSDWLSAFKAHPRIGDKDVLRARLASREANEQSGMSGLSDVELDAFMALNRAYEEKFGFIFLILALGKQTNGDIFMTDLQKMPHLLIAGATGTGKSVAINTLIASILYRCKPTEVRLVLVDPKMLELRIYAKIPHLLLPVVTDARKAANTLRWCVNEMMRRYTLLSEINAKDIDNYNEKVVKLSDEMREKHEPLPFIVIIIDELADLMLVAAKDIEDLIARLAQMARAAGIHMILATQTPRADVITGLIKANFKARIAFRVTSKLDSRIILDTFGAETLLGKGDMLLLSPDFDKLKRIHGAYITEDETERMAEFLAQQEPPSAHIEIPDADETGNALGNAVGVDEGSANDGLYQKALDIVRDTGKASASMLQRRLSIGYNRASRMIEQMECDGYIGPAEGAKQREVYVERFS